MAIDIDGILKRVHEPVENGTYSFETCPTRRDNMGPYFPQDVIAALLCCNGSIVDAARMLGRRRSNLQAYILRHPEVVDFLAEYNEGILDRVETLYVTMALSGDVRVMKHMLSTRGRHRGWGAAPIVAEAPTTDKPFEGFNMNVVTPNG